MLRRVILDDLAILIYGYVSNFSKKGKVVPVLNELSPTP
jgi:hypothetical protein